MARIAHVRHRQPHERRYLLGLAEIMLGRIRKAFALQRDDALIALAGERLIEGEGEITLAEHVAKARLLVQHREPVRVVAYIAPSSEEHTSELQSLMRTYYAVLCLKKHIHYQPMLAT